MERGMYKVYVGAGTILT